MYPLSSLPQTSGTTGTDRGRVCAWVLRDSEREKERERSHENQLTADISHHKLSFQMFTSNELKPCSNALMWRWRSLSQGTGEGSFILRYWHPTRSVKLGHVVDIWAVPQHALGLWRHLATELSVTASVCFGCWLNTWDLAGLILHPWAKFWEHRRTPLSLGKLSQWQSGKSLQVVDREARAKDTFTWLLRTERKETGGR